MQFEEIAECLVWWKKRQENERAWKVASQDVLKYDDDCRPRSLDLYTSRIVDSNAGSS
jgi:type I restriction enzyme M protein